MCELRFGGKLGIQQRVLPKYRRSFFELLALHCAGGLGIFSGQPLPGEGISTAGELSGICLEQGRNRNFRRPDSSIYLCWQEGVINWLEMWQPDVLIVEANYRYLSTYKAMTWMKNRGRYLIGWGLGAPSNDGMMGKFVKILRQKMLRNLDGYIAYSHKGAQEIKLFGMKPERVFVAPNAVAPRPSFSLPDKPSGYLGTPRVLYVGRLQERKKIDHLIYACSQVKTDLQPDLMIIGDGPAREDLENLAKNLYPRTTFTGEQYGGNLRHFFEQADLFVLPGTGGLAVQEAMGHGLPVIVSEGDGTQNDLVRPGNGWQIPAGDREALVNSLNEALKDPDRLRAMGKESYRIVKEEVNIEKMVDVFVIAITSITQ